MKKIVINNRQKLLRSENNEKIGVHDVCIGCGAKEDEPECECEWATCNCGYPDCWVREDGTYHCRNCDHDTNPRAYD